MSAPQEKEPESSTSKPFSVSASGEKSREAKLAGVANLVAGGRLSKALACLQSTMSLWVFPGLLPFFPTAKSPILAFWRFLTVRSPAWKSLSYSWNLALRLRFKPGSQWGSTRSSCIRSCSISWVGRSTNSPKRSRKAWTAGGAKSLAEMGCSCRGRILIWLASKSTTFLASCIYRLALHPSSLSALSSSRPSGLPP